MFWDCIFSYDFKNKFEGIDDDPFAFLDYLCVAMFSYIKDNIKGQDLITIYQCFYNYPQPQSPNELIQLALQVKGKFIY